MRGADDIADSPALSPQEKLDGLDRFEAALVGKTDDVAAARPLRAALAEHRLSPRHAQDLLHAFRMDAVKQRYANFDELMNYCAYSAAPVGRFVLDVHGESEVTWPANDALCSALQIINHIQDCGADYRNLEPGLCAARWDGEGRGRGHRACRAARLGGSARLPASARRANRVAGPRGKRIAAPGARSRLSLETAVIARLAQRLVTMLRHRDPLSQHVHLTKPGVLALTLFGIGAGLLDRGKRASPHHAMRDA